MISPVKLWRNQKKIRELLGQTGTVVSFTKIRVPPAGFEDQAPYIVVLVQLEHKMQIGQLVGAHSENIKIGQLVKAVIRRVRKPDSEGVIPYGIKFKIIQRHESTNAH